MEEHKDCENRLEAADFDAQLAQAIAHTDAAMVRVTGERIEYQISAKRCTGQLESLRAQRRRYVKALGHNPNPATDEGDLGGAANAEEYDD